LLDSPVISLLGAETRRRYSFSHWSGSSGVWWGNGGARAPLSRRAERAQVRMARRRRLWSRSGHQLFSLLVIDWERFSPYTNIGRESHPTPERNWGRRRRDIPTCAARSARLERGAHARRSLIKRL